VIARLRSLSISCSLRCASLAARSDYFQKHLFRHVIRAGAGDYYAAGLSNLIAAGYFFIAACCCFDARAILGKRWWVKDDRVKTFAGYFHLTQRIEYVASRN